MEHLGSPSNTPEQTEITFVKRKVRTIPGESQGHGETLLLRPVSKVMGETHRQGEFHSEHLLKETL